MTTNITYLFMCVFSNPISLVKCLLMTFAHFLNWIVFVSLFYCGVLIMDLRDESLFRCVVSKYFLPCSSFSFYPLNSLFHIANIFHSDEVQYADFFPFIGHASGVKSKKSPLSISSPWFLLCYHLKVLQFMFYMKVYDSFWVNFCIRCKT